MKNSVKSFHVLIMVHTVNLFYTSFCPMIYAVRAFHHKLIIASQGGQRKKKMIMKILILPPRRADTIAVKRFLNF